MFVSSLPWRYSHQRLQTHKFGANFTSTKLRVYLVVVDICIVDCHMFPGLPKSCTLTYILAEASMQYINPLYASIFPSTWYHEIRVTRS